jgi:hypothetical protein
MSDEADPYRLYILNSAGRIDKAQWVDAESDEQALAKVGAMNLRADAELWSLTRKVAVVRAAVDPASLLAPDQQP